ncbi:chemotaxis protein CheW [Maridesulfovibrio sp.]|uniref:chemotaxis protein CheW n=1 Tax=unclassified Maridesulfovibrio TaxID=2794999 RepID=UPI003B008931
MTSANISSQGQYLTFTLNKEIFALDIVKVREVLELSTISTIPRTPEYMKGVINLRGHAVPVMDMRLKLGMSPTEYTVDTCIIILEVDYSDEEMIVMGALVDSVREVFGMSEDDIEPAPKMGSSIEANYIKGMGRQEDQFIIIVDVNKVFSEEELLLALDIDNESSEGQAA